MPTPRRILVTSALPYANGPIHIGHLLEHIQTDIWVRAQKLAGNTCYYVCADDAHGTAVMMSAEKAGLQPEEWIDRMRAEHERDLRAFGVDYDIYDSTHSPETRAFSESIYLALKKKGHIATRTLEQFYDPEREIFLADRYIKGTCPACQAKDQYGDNCEVCGKTYTPEELENPYSVLSGATPIKKETEHFFFRLPDFTAFLDGWLQKETLQSGVRNKLREWFRDGLKEWDITRDAPYFGFLIPGETDKYFYVWLDAPIGYLGAFAKLCASAGIDFESFWQEGSDSELYHFIGKDIIYFHGLFWPAMLKGAGKRTPSAIYAHGFLTVNGQKLSKSRGTAINARDYLNVFDPLYLRYYLASKLTTTVDDLDFVATEFIERCNSDLVGKFANIASRCARFISRDHANTLAATLGDEQHALLQEFASAAEAIRQDFEDREFARATRRIMALADRANQYIDAEKPWQHAKNPANAEAVHKICTLGINMFRLLAIYLKPIIPDVIAKAEAFLNIPPLNFEDARSALLNHRVNTFQPLVTRITPDDMAKLIPSS